MKTKINLKTGLMSMGLLVAMQMAILNAADPSCTLTSEVTGQCISLSPTSGGSCPTCNTEWWSVSNPNNEYCREYTGEYNGDLEQCEQDIVIVTATKMRWQGTMNCGSLTGTCGSHVIAVGSEDYLCNQITSSTACN